MNKQRNLIRARDYAKREYTRTNKDQFVFLYFDEDNGAQPSYIKDREYYLFHTIAEQDVYGLVFYGTGGYNEPPAFVIKYY